MIVLMIALFLVIKKIVNLFGVCYDLIFLEHAYFDLKI